MGLFDNILVEKPLPLPKDQGELVNWSWTGHNFQTKDLDCAMSAYKIDSDGQLWKECFDYVDKTEEELAKEKEENKGNKWFFQHPVKVSRTYWEKDSHTGYVNFYDGFYDNLEIRDTWKNDYWVEWCAHIVDGKVKSVELFKWESEDNTERKERQAVHDAEWKARAKYESTFRFKYCFKYWNNLMRFIFYNITKFGNWVYSISTNLWKVERKITF